MRVPGAFAVLLGLLLAIGCGNGGGGGFSDRPTNQGDGAGGNVLSYPIANNPTSLDPHKVQDGDTLDIVQQVYEGLVGWSTNNEPVGLLAEKWEISEDGKTYTFTLKKDVKFHNGQVMTADDVVWSLERACSPRLASPTATAYLDDIVGVTDKFAGTAETIAGVKKVDDHTVSLTLKRPTPYFLGKLTYLTCAVMPKDMAPLDKDLTDLSQMIGTGPFKMTKFDPEQRVYMEAFADYHGGRPQLDAIERLVMGDAVTRLNAYKTGKVQLVQLERQDVEGVKADYGDQLHYLPRPAIWYIGLNQLAYEPFKNRDVRRAFAMAIDRDKIVNDLLGGVNQPAMSIVPPGVPGHRDEANYIKYDPAAAKALLASAGYPDGKGLPALQLKFRDERPDIRIASEAIAGQIRQNLGVEVTLQAQEWGAYLEAFNRKQQGFYHMRWAADFLDPQNFLSHMLATWGPENKLGYNSADFDRLCAEGDKTLDMATRIPLYQQAEDVVLQDAVWIPLYFQKDVELQVPNLTGMRDSLFGHLPHTTTTLKAQP
ncbi:MAG: peptide ABC transporter substrate-binding protein [Fimbriimonadaceae bacterium]|nr:peptide ABC transporter substrate-binding protein [Fimbriimonadaceae bacterium]